MNSSASTPVSRRFAVRQFLLLFACLAAVLAALFHDSFKDGHVIFNNDGPLGVISNDAAKLPDTFTGYWNDLNWVGGEQPSAVPNISVGLNFLLGPYLFSKVYAPASLFILGLCAWLFFRQLKFGPVACVLGALAAALNMHFFSTACWGVASHPLTFAMNFLALAALADSSARRRWIRVVLAGLAVGMGIMEGYDIGAIFSLFVAAFVIYQTFVQEQGPAATRLARGGLRVAVVAVCAAFIATHALNSLIGTQIKGVSGTAQDAQTRQQQWDFATQWSLPKIETLRVAIPGLFGYRMHTPGGSEYWGSIGQQPGWEKHRQGFVRYSGGGEYAGLLVVVMAIWAACQSFRKTGSPYTDAQRKFIWFWLGVAAVSLLLAFGRYAPFYKLFYALPYMSTIRNPAKFTHVFHWALVILSAYGIHGLCRHYVEKGLPTPGTIKDWWRKSQGFDRKWVNGSMAALGACLLGWLVYASGRNNLIAHLKTVQFDQAQAAAIARFSFMEVGWFILFLALTLGLVALVMRGYFAGAKAKWAGVALGALLVVDLARTNVPWIIHWDIKEKYASNPIVEILRDDAHLHRVTVVPFQGVSPHLSMFQQIYTTEWLGHLFQYYNIQSIDRIQEPRVAVENTAYRQALSGGISEVLRMWELTNTRYLLGLGGNFVDMMNQQLDPQRQRFRLHTQFTLFQTNATAPIQVATNTTGPFALIEFSGALPRAALYSQWEVMPDQEAALKRIASPAFDPNRSVVVTGDVPAPPAGAGEQTAGTVDFVNYEPKHIKLRAKTTAPSVLLLNDKHDDDWTVTVDGEPRTLLRANYLMRGVHLEPGEHLVEFRFQPKVPTLYVSLAGIALGLALIGYLIASPQTSGEQPAAPASPEPEPAKPVPTNASETAKKKKKRA